MYMYAKHIKLILFLSLIYFSNIFSQTDFIKGADISYLPQLEDSGAVFKENEVPRDFLQILKSHGVNYIRLRIWLNPPDGYNNLEHVEKMALRLKTLGFGFLLDFHYSDTWADPGKQYKPALWKNLSFQDLQYSLRYYTKYVIQELKKQNTLPDIVQIGNEVTNGFLWDDGKIDGSTAQWEKFSTLVKEAIAGVRDAVDSTDKVKIMIHIDTGGDAAKSLWFFNNLITQNVSFDIIGLSYYPFWSGPLVNLSNTLDQLADTFHKNIIVVETAYPWTLQGNDSQNNFVWNQNQLLSGYPATVDGQYKYLADLISLITNTDGGSGVGFFYWEPDDISLPRIATSWENLTLFDFNGNALSSLNAFDIQTSAVTKNNILPAGYILKQNYPNPFNPATTIEFLTPEKSHIKINIYNSLGEFVESLTSREYSAGLHKIYWDASKFASGVYLYQMQSDKFLLAKQAVLLK